MRFIYKEKASVPFHIIGTIALLSIGAFFRASGIMREHYQYYICGVLLAIIILWGMYFQILRKNNNSPTEIITDENGISFPVGKNKEFVKFSDVDKFYSIKYEEATSDGTDNKSITVMVTKDNKRYEFEAAKFDSSEKFRSFNTLMKSACKNLSPIK